MTSQEEKLNAQRNQSSAKTIDLQGVAAFAGLVELLAQELGTAPGRIQGLLPNGTSFEELVGEVTLVSQGFERSITLHAKPGAPLRMIFVCRWRGNHGGLEPGDAQLISGVEAQFYLDSTVEQISPQGRALARHVEDCLALLDRMVTLGQSAKLSTMSISHAEIEAFESSEAGNLVRNSYWKQEQSRSQQGG